MAYKLFSEKLTDYGKTYRGGAEECTFTFKTGPEQFDPIGSWLRSYFVGKMVDSVESHGGKVLKVELWRDTGPTFDTWWKGIVTADVSAEMGSSGAALRSPAFPWLAVIALAIVVILVFNIESVKEIIWGPGGRRDSVAQARG